MSKLQGEPSALKREHPALQKMKFQRVALKEKNTTQLFLPTLLSEHGT
jgi:hypothetical protein